MSAAFRSRLSVVVPTQREAGVANRIRSGVSLEGGEDHSDGRREETHQEDAQHAVVSGFHRFTLVPGHG
ncbi:hypothetical protein, partial [Streptomyces sp. NPDC056491]|uniref:hypothetical protein n=1 Tax=Streptomyces sp. NPDC056491 TaxID=3345837 RepID=UPI0036B21CBD